MLPSSKTFSYPEISELADSQSNWYGARNQHWDPKKQRLLCSDRTVIAEGVVTVQLRVSSVPRPSSREEWWGRTIVVLASLSEGNTRTVAQIQHQVQVFLPTRAEAKLSSQAEKQ